jgi:hypothetical protein
MSAFTVVWGEIRRQLSIGTEIRNWSYDSGYTGKVTHIQDKNYDEIVVTSEGINGKRRISRREFEKLFELWDRYRAGHIPRDEIQEVSRNSTYILSILHWLDEASGGAAQTS